MWILKKGLFPNRAQHKWRSEDGIQVTRLAFLISVGLHSAVFGWLLVKAPSKALLMSSVKGSPNAGSVTFDVIEAQRAAPPALPTRAATKSLPEKDPDGVSLPKNPTTDLAQKSSKSAEAPNSQNSKSGKTHTSKDTNTQAAGLVGFDLQNVKGNLPPELQRYFTTLRLDIEKHKRYPKLAKRLRQSGRVVLKFQIVKNGKIENVLVEEPSPFQTLNESAKKLVSDLKSEYPLPESLKAERIEIKLPVSYKL